MAGLLLIMASGGAIDFSRATSLATKLQSGIDSGALAAAALNQTGDANDVVTAYVLANLESSNLNVDELSLNVTFNETINSREVYVTASYQLPTLFLGIFGIDAITVQRDSEAIDLIQDIEISLVLDVSGSMSGSKINELRQAASEFVEWMFSQNPDRTSISVIPYNGGVRLPSEVNEYLVAGPASYSARSGCLEHGLDYVTDIELPADGLDWLEWIGTPQVGLENSSYCPSRYAAEAVFVSSNEGSLLSLIDDLFASGQTGLDVAAGWGLRALSPQWRGLLGSDFADRPADFGGDDTVKVLILMTDGAITSQHRDWSDTLYSASTARGFFIDVCDQAKDLTVSVYTIAFQVSGHTNRQLMEDCASSSDHFYEVSDLNISEAFSAIASDIMGLRISQ